ncbi:uncharacterized protein [Epargyreus clarus]|uniref:uncharacterized protein n=1 Tax=Epargyreus clarus TaxID=520877 RepID=UPI003C2B7CAC
MSCSRSSKILALLEPSTSSNQESHDINNDNLFQHLPETNKSIPIYDNLQCNLDGELDFDSDDSVFDKDYVPPNLISAANSNDSDFSSNIIPNSQSRNITVPESPECCNDENTPQDLTKKGNPRKRKKYDQSVAERRELKKLNDMESKYKLKPGCDIKLCKKKCHESFTEDERKDLNKFFRKLSWKDQQYFIRNNTSKEEPKRKTVKENRKIDRNTTVTYFLSKDKGTKLKVCKIFFLETLGFNRRNDKAVRNALSGVYNGEPLDGRGSNPNINKIDETKIIEHINSFNPSVSHYRRIHAPNKKYLPSDLTVSKMYQDFCEKQPTDNPGTNQQVSYEYYRKVVKKLNISFTKLGHEECEICEKYFLHNAYHKELRHRKCEDCRSYEHHHQKYVTARQEYKKDVNKQNTSNMNPETAYFSADLEKVIMLPRIEQFKIVMFCPRIIIFNESFVPIGDKKRNPVCQTFAAIWHEAVSGRKMSDIASCFKAFLHANRDLKHIVIWLDNCASQNKNWTLYSYLTHLVNSVEVNFDSIKLKYLEVGHTFMSADEFHHQVELAMKKKKHLYDFEDFHQTVASTRTNINVKVMNLDDFCQFEDCSSSYKLQNTTPRAYLSDMCEVTFHRGTHIIQYKTDFTSESEYSLDFLRLKNIKSGIPPPKVKSKYRGITYERKTMIIQKLTPLMPDNRKPFWYNLPINNDSVDLSRSHEED